MNFQTDRLTAEPLNDKHLPELCQISGDPRAMATLSIDGSTYSEEETQDGLHKELEHWNKYDHGQWIFYDKETERFVGRAGLKHCYVEGQFEIELSYALVPDFWGRGMATEMVKTLLEFGFNQLKLPEIVCFTLPTNIASQRVMQKSGFQYEKEGTYSTLPHVFYRLNAAEWNQRQSEE